jgi:hypothetical protein
MFSADAASLHHCNQYTLHTFWHTEGSAARSHRIVMPCCALPSGCLRTVCLRMRHQPLALAAPPQTRPHLLAVAAGDAFVRVYDRRMLSLKPGDGGSVGDCSGRAGSGHGAGSLPLLLLAPAHLLPGEAAAWLAAGSSA